MVISTDALNETHGFLIADMPDTATVGGEVITCNRSNRLAQKEGRRQDIIDGFMFTLIFQVSALADAGVSAPVPGNTITYRSTVYRVLDTDESPELLELRTIMGSRYQKRG